MCACCGSTMRTIGVVQRGHGTRRIWLFFRPTAGSPVSICCEPSIALSDSFSRLSNQIPPHAVHRSTSIPPKVTTSIEAVHFGQFTSRSSAAGAAVGRDAIRRAGSREAQASRVARRREPQRLDERRIVAEEERAAALSRDLLEAADAGE